MAGIGRIDPTQDYIPIVSADDTINQILTRDYAVVFLEFSILYEKYQRYPAR